MISYISQAGTVYTTNGTSTDWATATAWTPNGFPDHDDHPNDLVIINHDMTFTGDLGVKGSGSSLIINSGATLTITGALSSSWICRSKLTPLLVLKTSHLFLRKGLNVGAY